MRRAGFTLIELMITVGIIGLLAAIAIPNFLRFQLKSKVTEASTNLRAIASAQDTFYAEHSFYVSASNPVPASVPSNQKVAWTVSPEFGTLGWSPEGAVFFQYAITADDGANGPRFTAEARGDVDGDGTFSFFAFVRPSRGQPAGLDGVLPGTTCLGTGVISAGSGTAKGVPGACDHQSGVSTF